MQQPPAPLAKGTATQVSPRVWRGQLAATGEEVALKIAAHDAPLKGEVVTLQWLARQRCPVPRVVAVDTNVEPAWVALEWAGDETLDRALQSANPQRRLALGRRLVRAVDQMEVAFAALTEGARANEARWQMQTDALRETIAPWADAAPAGLGWLLRRDLRQTERDALARVLDVTLDGTPEIGSLDYHAGNVVVDGTRLTFVDWSAVGVDLPERRLAQWGTATGTGLTDGNFVSAIGPATVRLYPALAAERRGQREQAVAEAVDAHGVLLLLTAAASLLLVAEGRAHPGRVAAWPNVEARRERLRELLCRRLVPRGPAERLRALLSKT